jgi:tetratricopeptide (TPR) repeat protein
VHIEHHASAAWAPWAAGLLAAICYANSLTNGFTYDDNSIVRDHPRIRSLANQREIWLSDWWYVEPDDLTSPDPARDRLYRPLTLFTFAMNYAAGGLNPLGYHAVNVALHVLCSILVWHFAFALLRRGDIATVAALLFAVHPIHCEAVANIVGRAEVLAALFMLLGLILLLRRGGPAETLIPASNLAFVGLAAAAFLAATLAKETAVSYPLVALIALHHALSGRRPRWTWWLTRLAVLCAPLAVYFPMRWVALEGRLVRDEDLTALFNPLFLADAAGRLIGPVTIFGHYARLLLVPSKLSADYGMGVISPVVSLDFWTVSMTILGAVTAVVLVVALLGYRRPRGTPWRDLAMLSAMFLASYVLISNTLLLIGVSLGERLMYWPSAPAILLIATALAALWRRYCVGAGLLAERASLLRAMALILLAALGVRTATRNAAWADDVALFSTDIREWPDNVQMSVTRARHLIYDASRSDDPKNRLMLLFQAEELVRRALEIYKSADAYRTMGELLALRGEPARALEYLYLARELNPRDVTTHNHIASLEGRDDTAEADLRRRIQDAPDDPAIRVQLASLLIQTGRHRMAREHLEHALALDAASLPAKRLMAQVLMLDNESEPAIATYRAVLERDPNDWESHQNLAVLLQQVNPGESLAHAKRAWELQPNHFATILGLAEAHLLNGHREEALARMRQLLRSLPVEDPRRGAVEERIEQIERRGR